MNTMPLKPKKAIHLLYVPTIYCNMGCTYCYLGDETDASPDFSNAVTTLKFVIENFTHNGYIPFNVSFHGGEVTTLSGDMLEQLFVMTLNYYRDFDTQIRSFGHTPTPLHIKTNLYNFDKHYDLLDRYGVSISGSVDLPLSLHEKYRVDKKGKSTLHRTISNLKLLASYPHHKKISCVVTKEHLKYIDAFIDDIRTIHSDIGLDMTYFNIMFAFDSLKNSEKFVEKDEGTQMLDHEEQVLFYRKIYDAFRGSDLDYGLRTHWFKEFTPEYCCSAPNCGDKFFLVQSNGDVFSCPRGQSSREYYYGNVFEMPIDDIIEAGGRQIALNENKMAIDEGCLECEYFSYCFLGCPFVRTQTQTSKSYTCLLQKEIYKDNPQKYPPLPPQTQQKGLHQYLYQNKITALQTLPIQKTKTFTITNELYDPKNSIASLIENDTVLQSIYSDTLFSLRLGGQKYDLSSQILKNRSDILFFEPTIPLKLLFKKEIFSINCNESDEVNNYLHLMVLRDTPVVYGDEGRTKQEHLFDFSIYKGSLLASSFEEGEWYSYDLSPLFTLNASLFIDGVKNNLFVTTKTMREYHYEKHRKNGFYHIQAVNLPFANCEFYFLEG